MGISTHKFNRKYKLFKIRARKKLATNIVLYVFLLPTIAYYIIFRYAPIYGLIIAFKDYKPFVGIINSPWATEHGFHYFISFFQSIYLVRLLRNTFLLSFLNVLFNFPLPIVFALFLHELKLPRFRSFVQTSSYIPHFISVVVVCGMVVDFLKFPNGLINNFLAQIETGPINFFRNPNYFRGIYIISSIWQSMGWSSIIYYAVLSNIDPTLYESADIDGANRRQKIMSISIPCIAPTIITLLLLNLGRIMTVGFEKVLLLYNPVIYEKADVLSTYVYRAGIIDQQYSFAAAVGLFNSLIRFTLILIFNSISRRFSETSLW